MSPRAPAAWLLAAAALVPGCDGDSIEKDTRDIERAYYALRDALLQADDEAFFALHASEARDWAVESFPGIRSGYLAGSPEQKEAFRRLYRVTEEEFLAGEPRALVVRMMPWRSGWRERREMFRTAVVKDVRIDYIQGEAGGTERRGVVELDPRVPGFVRPGDPPPTVIFVKEGDAWLRRTFFTEEIPDVGAPGRPGR